jgi:DNA-binding response OmpR family regulator
MTMRVLVLDDEESIRLLAHDLLTEEGFEVRCGADGEEGLAILDAWRPDVIVLDLMMPRMNGSDFLSRMRERGADVPFVVLSGARETSALSRELGAAAAIMKPFDLDDFIDTVRRAGSAAASSR